MKTSEIRKEAREALKGKWGKAACITLVYIALSFIVGMIQGLAGEGTILYNIIDLAYLIISIPLSFGLLISFIKLKRNENVSCIDFLKDSFSRFGKSWGIWFHTLLKLLLPMICLIVIAILMAVLVSVNIISGNAGLSIGFIILTVVLYIAILTYAIMKSYLYVLAYNISYDNPDFSSKACVLKSEALMKGNRKRCFLLELSFIGWVILAILAFGIGILWVIPYMQVAMVCFYENLAKPEEKIEEAIKTEE